MTTAHPTRQRLIRTLARLEAQQAGLLDSLRDLPTEALHRSPSPRAWSIAQVLDHLIKVERFVLPKIQESLAGRERRISFLGPFRRIAVLVAMYLPTRVPVPPAVSTVRPDAGLPDLSTIRASWLTARADFTTAILSVPDDQLDRPLLKHPVGGWMTLAQALRFLHSHVHHHLYQINRLRKL